MAIEGYSDNDARTYKGNDIDSDGDGRVDDAEKVKGNDIDSDGDGRVDDAEKVKGNDIDSDGDGKVDNADQLDGNDASAFLQSESWYFSFYSDASANTAPALSTSTRAHDVDFDTMLTNNQTFDAVGKSNSGNSATARLRDVTNGATIASVSTTSTSNVRLTDTTWNNPSGQVTVGVDGDSDNDNFLTVAMSASSTR